MLILTVGALLSSFTISHFSFHVLSFQIAIQNKNSRGQKSNCEYLSTILRSFFFFFGKQQGVTLLKAIRCITTRWFLDHFLLITNVTNVKTQHFYNFYLKLRKLRNGKVRISTSKSSQKKTLIESSWSQYQFDMHQL